jgi:predicted type IV restriction endonuclease
MQIDLAERAVRDFLNRFDKNYEPLLYYAALPLILTPELLHYLRHHFTPQVPFVAEVDLLLSEDMCRERTFEQYTMHSNIRNFLLSEARKKIDVAEAAGLLMGYLRDIERSKAYVSLNDLQAQAWSAMVYMDEYRGDAVEQIQDAFRRIAHGKNISGMATTAEIERLARLTEAFSEDLTDYPDLVEYARLVKKFARDEAGEEDFDKAKRFQAGSVPSPLELTGYQLPTNQVNQRIISSEIPQRIETIFGRHDLLVSIIDELINTDATGVANIVTLTGSAGIGKTVLAATVCRNEQVIQYFSDGICWVRANVTSEVYDLIRDILRQIGVIESDKTANFDLGTFERVTQDKKLLVVFDDVYDFRVLAPFFNTRISEQGRLSYLVTTRELSAELSPYNRVFQVGELDKESALNLVKYQLNRLGHDFDNALLETLVAQLDYHPFALTLASRMIREQDVDINERSLSEIIQEIANRVDQFSPTKTGNIEKIVELMLLEAGWNTEPFSVFDNIGPEEYGYDFGLQEKRTGEIIAVVVCKGDVSKFSYEKYARDFVQPMLQQAGITYAFVTDGKKVIEVDRNTGRTWEMEAFPHIDDLANITERRLVNQDSVEQLVAMLSSSDNTTALTATQHLRETGWLTDGSCENASLPAANLDGADLSNARLFGVNLERANLDGANLSGADLRNANLKQSNIEGANLRGTNLTSADLSEAQITLASFDEKTILPDGTPWTPETDIARFTDPNHPDFYIPIIRKTVYLCYAQEDVAIARIYCNSGKDNYHFLNKIRDDVPNIEFHMAAATSLIERTNRFILLWSENAAQSEIVSAELDYALGQSIRITPLFWKKPLANLPARLSHLNFQYIGLNFNETQTRELLIEPMLKRAGWDTDPFILRQELKLDPQSVADYVLHFNESPIAVVEAKRLGTDIRDRIDQAKRYASMLDVRLVFVTNGEEIFQVDIVNNREIRLDRFPSAESLVSTSTSDVDLPSREEPRNRTYVLGEVIQTASEIESLLLKLLAQEGIESDINARGLGRLWMDIQRTSISISEEYTSRFAKFRELRNQVVHSVVENLPSVDEMDKTLHDIQEVVKFLQDRLDEQSESSQVSNSPNVDAKDISVRDTTLEKISTSSIKLESVSTIGLGITTGLNEAFIIDGSQRTQLIGQDNSSADIIKPLLRGQDIRDWKLDDPDLYVIWTDRDIDLTLYPGVKKYLEQYRQRLSARRNFDNSSWYQLTRSRNRKELDTVPKITFPKMGNKYVFSIDLVGYYPLDSVSYIIPTSNVNPYYLLGILNSNVNRFWLQSRTRGSTVPQVNITTLREISLPDIPLNNQRELGKLTEERTKTKNVSKIADIEHRINRIVYQIYDLSEVEVGFIEQTLSYG